MPAFYRIAHDLTDKRLRPLAASTAPAAPFSGPDMEIVVAHSGNATDLSLSAVDGAFRLETIEEIEG